MSLESQVEKCLLKGGKGRPHPVFEPSCLISLLQFLRVRTVSGPTYYCRTGMSYKGHVKEKFLLVDCMVVLSGSYR